MQADDTRSAFRKLLERIVSEEIPFEDIGLIARIKGRNHFEDEYARILPSLPHACSSAYGNLEEFSA